MPNNKSNNIHALRGFIQEGVWRIRANKLPKKQFFFLRQLRIILLAVRGFNEDQCSLRASALTFYSLLSIVPIAAMAFGVAKGFGFEKLLEEQINTAMVNQPEVASQIINFSTSFLENTKGGLIAGIGVAILFWTIIKVLGQIEESFNEIWGIKKGRSLGRKSSDYLSVMLICPILLIMAGSMTVVITSQITFLVNKLSFLGPIVNVILFLLQTLPFVMTWLVFSFIYIFMPNTRVNYSAGILGGIIAGTIYQVVQWIYIKFQIGVSQYGAVYGSFAAMPLFLVWLQLSWLVVLFGAEISFAEQNVETYEFEPDCDKVSPHFRRQVALVITQMCVAQFRDGREPLSSAQIADHLDLPIRLVRDIIFLLAQAGVLSEIRKSEEEKVIYYQPAIDPDKLSVKAVLDRLDYLGADNIPYNETKEYATIKNTLKHFSSIINASDKNILLKDIR